MTTARSAYPVPVEELLPRARELAHELGEVPSRNRLMSELKIGAPKAKTVRAELLAEEREPREHAGSAHLHLVPAEAPQTNAVSADTEPPTEPIPVMAPECAFPGPDSTRLHGTAESDVEEAAAPPITHHADPGPRPEWVSNENSARTVRPWPVLLLALPAFVAIWSGWVGLGGLTGFGIVHPLPGIWDELRLNTAITLPIGVETYAAYALRVWLSGQVPARARRFAKISALGSLLLGALGQIAYHLMTAAGMTAAPWWITTLVSCLPVAVLGMGAALTHLLHDTQIDDRTEVE